MSAIQPQKNFDVIEAISLERTNGERVRSIKITRNSENWMWSSREPLKNLPIILLIISKSFRAGNVNIIRQKQKNIPPLLKYCWENLTHSTLPGEFFVLHKPEIYTDYWGLSPRDTTAGMTTRQETDRRRRKSNSPVSLHTWWIHL